MKEPVKRGADQRKPKPQRVAILSFRLSTTELERYRKEAKDAGVHVSDWIRGALCVETERAKTQRASRVLPIADDRLLRRLVEIRNMLDEARRRLQQDGEFRGRTLIVSFVKIERHLRALARGVKCL